MTQFGTSDIDEGWGIALDLSGEVVLSGSTYASLEGPHVGSGDGFVRKLSRSGDFLWTRQYGTAGLDVGYDVSLNHLGDVYVTGLTRDDLASPSNGAYDAYLIKYSGSGAEQWRRQLGTSSNDFAFDVSADRLGSVYVAGDTYGSLSGSNQGLSDIFVQKRNAEGGVEWTRQVGTATHDFSRGIASDGLGNVYVGGTTSGILGTSWNLGQSDVFLASYDSTGIQQWVRQFGTSGGEFLQDITVDDAGNIYLTGYTEGSFGLGSSGGQDAFLSKFSTDGVHLWTAQLGSNLGDVPNAVTYDASGNIYIGGYTYGQIGERTFGDQDAFVSKFDPSGNLIWTKQFGTVHLDAIYGLTADAMGNVFVTGRTDGSLGGQALGGGDVFVAKISVVPEPSSVALCIIALIGLTKIRCGPGSKELEFAIR